MEVNTDCVKELSEQMVNVFNEVYNKIKPIISEAFRIVKQNFKALECIVQRALKASGKYKYLKRCRNRDKLYAKRRRMGR